MRAEHAGRSILIVEDNPTALKLFRLTLEAEGYLVRSAADAHSALDRASEQPPDLVLQDLLLPDMDGISLLRALRSLRPESPLPVVAISGFKTLRERAFAEPGGFDEILIKPVEPTRLVELVRGYLPLPARADDSFGAGKSVLVIDDDPAQLKLVRLRLQFVGFQVSTASDEASALEHVQRQSPDVVLCDVLMPQTDGYELCQALRRLPGFGQTPVVLVSAYYGGPQDEQLARRVGASALVTRTPELDAVLTALRNALSGVPTLPPAPPEPPRQEHLSRVVAQLERQARTNAGIAERSALQAAQLSILAGIAEALLGSEDVEAAFGDVLAACLDAGGVSRAALYRIDEQGELLLSQAMGFSDDVSEPLERAFGCSERVVGSRRGGVVPVSTCLVEEDARALLQLLRASAAVFIPLWEGDYCIGALLLGVSSSEMSEQDLSAFARAVGAQISQALALTESFSRLRDAAEAGRVLADSLDLDETVAALARLATARLADVCEIELIGQEPRIFTSDRVGDPTLVARVRTLRSAYPRALPPLDEAPTSSRGALVAQIDEGKLRQQAQNSEHLQLLRGLELKSEIVVPLQARGRTLGTVSLARIRAGRPFTPRDRMSAEDLASRAAIALDSANLYQVAQSANRTKDEFLATVSHELRTPLTAILGWARMLISGVPTAKREHAYRVIERNAHAQSQLIEDLVDTSRIICGQMRIDLQPTDLTRVIDTAVESLKPALELKHIELRRSSSGEPIHLRCDGARLQQVIWNLVSNAVKFTPSGGRIELSVAVREGHVVLWVRDDGQGIAAEFLGLVFDRFKQAEGGITRAQGGLGLGLAISRHLVELHGGTISVHSDGKGRGATFTVELPFVEARADSNRPRDPASNLQEVRQTRLLADLEVLVVDDDADTRELLLETLQESGARARGVSSAAEAFEAVANDCPDILLSDIGMPGEDGYSLIRRIRTLPAARGGGVPAAAITAYARSEDRSLAIDAGFQLHLTKPIDPSTLVAAVVSLNRMTAGTKLS